jgi:hypothetical protein
MLAAGILSADIIALATMNMCSTQLDLWRKVCARVHIVRSKGQVEIQQRASHNLVQKPRLFVSPDPRLRCSLPRARMPTMFN